VARLSILHETRYDYARPVGFGLHRLLVRPRDSHAIRLVSASLELSPGGDTRWVYDALGNCVCLLQPRGEATSLTVTSRLVIERFPAPLSPLTLDDPRTGQPIVYDRGDRTVLEPFMAPVTDDSDTSVLRWVRGEMRPEEPALDFVMRLNTDIHRNFGYSARVDEGVQSPGQTLALGSGACRDFAWLMVEALRRLGYAARFVTGYIYSARLDAGGDSSGAVRGAGATHAWCEVFLPGLGWTEFDPTNGLAESPDLIPVAVTRTPDQAAPVSGAIIGDPGQSMLSVNVGVHAEDSLQAAA
jgi:transglutaminase-like putative cysteine protease